MSEKATVTKQSNNGELSEQQAREKLAQIEQEQIAEFVRDYQVFVREHNNITWGGRAYYTDDGRTGVQLIPVRSQVPLDVQR